LKHFDQVRLGTGVEMFCFKVDFLQVDGW